jgi:hypothetical protein
MKETDLRARLEGLAERTAPPVQDPGDLTATVVARHHVQRHRQWALAAVAAVLVAVLVGVPAVLSRTTQDPAPAGPAHSSGIYTPPTRGDLSDDLDFVEGVRRLPWTTGTAGGDVPEPPLDTRHVVYASDVPGARWALVAGANPAVLPPDEGVDPADLDAIGSVAIAWFTGPADALANEMTLYSVPRLVLADQPTALSDTATGVAVVVGAPGDQIEVSRLSYVHSDGTPRREYSPEDAPDGMAVVNDSPVEGSIDRATRYRVTRDGEEFNGSPDGYPNPDFTPPDVELGRLHPAPSPALGDAAVTVGIDEVLSRTGVSTRALTFTVVWAGDLPTQDGGSARFTLLAVEFTEGGIYVLGALGWDGGGGFTTRACGSEARPAGTPLDEQLFVVRCAPDGGVPTNSLVVVAPPGTASVRALDASGGQLADYPLVDGVAVVPVPANLATVEVLDAAGDVVDQHAPMGHAPLGD